MQYVGSKAITVLGSVINVHIKANGLPDFTPFLYPNGVSMGFIRLTGSRSKDVTAINAKSGYAITPWAMPYGKYTWHHHEVPGVMILVPWVIHKAVGHFGGVLYWSIAVGQRYKS
jgi:hypothetical protein